jgi:hypothetical protein
MDQISCQLGINDSNYTNTYSESAALVYIPGTPSIVILTEIEASPIHIKTDFSFESGFCSPLTWSLFSAPGLNGNNIAANTKTLANFLARKRYEVNVIYPYFT